MGLGSVTHYVIGCMGVLCGALSGKGLDDSCALPNAKIKVSHSEFQIWDASSGLPQKSVHTLLKDQDGFLWIGTLGGLVRFDGSDYDVLDISRYPGLPSNRILDLAEGAGGAFWVGTSEGLVVYQDGSFRSVDSPLAEVRIRVLHRHTNGSLWVGTADGLFVERADQAEAFVQVWKGPVNSLSESSDGRMVVGGTSRVAVLSTNSPPAIEREHPLKVKAIWDTHLRDDGTMWIGADEGAYTLSLSGVLSRWREEKTFLIHEDQSGEVWVGSDCVPLVRGRVSDLNPKYPGQPVTFTGEPIKVAENFGVMARLESARCVLPDEEGIWIGMMGRGLVRLQSNKVQRVYPDVGTNEIAPIAWDGYSVWFQPGLPKRVQRLAHDGSVETFKELGHVRAMHANLEQNRLWIAAREGLYRFGLDQDGKIESQIRLYAFPKCKLIRSLFEDSTGRLWCGLREGLTELVDGRLVERGADALSGQFVYAIGEDASGTLWIGCDHGIVEYNPVTNAESLWSHREQGLARGPVRALYIDSDSVVWAGTYGGGLSRIAQGQVSTFSRDNGLVDDTVSSIVEDSEGYLWMLGNQGLSWAHRSEFDQVLRDPSHEIDMRFLDSFDGFGEGVWRGSQSTVMAGESVLWSGTVEGLYRIELDDFRERSNPPKVYIRSLSDDTSVLPEVRVSIDPNPEIVQVRFGAIEYARPDLVEFRYRLRSFGQRWINQGDGKRVEFHNLPPGDYQFDVMARCRGRVWPQAYASHRFSVLPAFYETRWARALLGLFLLGVLVLGLAKARRWERARKQSHERKVSQSMRNHQLEALGNLAGGLAHNINNTLQAIVGNAEYAKLESETQPSIQSAMDSILRATDSASDVVKGIMGFSRRQPQEPTPIRLDALMKTTQGWIQAAMPSKIPLELEIPDQEIWVMGDVASIQSILVNLVVNASEAMEGKRPVLVRVDECQVERDTSHDVIAVKPGPYGRIAICDFGKGMSPRVLERAFDPFFAASKQNKTGMGLSLVYGLVRRLSGGLRIRTAPGQGTRVEILLSRVDPMLPKEKAPPRTSSLPVVLIDDDERVLIPLARALCSQGFVVESFADPREALAFIESAKWPKMLVVTDEDMPEIKGHDVARRIRALESPSPVILLSGHGAEVTDAEMSLFARRLMKPVRGEELGRLLLQLGAQGGVDEVRADAPFLRRRFEWAWWRRSINGAHETTVNSNQEMNGV